MALLRISLLRLDAHAFSKEESSCGHVESLDAQKEIWGRIQRPVDVNRIDREKNASRHGLSMPMQEPPRSSAHYTRATEERKRALNDPGVPFAISSHAAAGIKRLVKRRRHFTRDLRKRPVVANVATARELACWVWALGRMSEGALA